jgi:glyoxylase-like metal-dependent hydrolase (beta-lactamase superfamily II)
MLWQRSPLRELRRTAFLTYTRPVATVERIELAYNNVYLVRDGGSLVALDTGPDYRGAREIISTALDGRRPELVIATHGHLDHAGLGSWWQERGSPVLLSSKDLPYARGTDFEFEALASYVRASGAPQDAEAETLEGLRVRQRWHDHLREAEGWAPASRDGRWPTQLRYVPFEPELLLHGERRDIDGLEVLAMPGHTAGNLVAYHSGEGWLFSGDQLLPEITPTPAIQFHHDSEGPIKRFLSLPRFLDSLAKLQALEFTRCFPGHGEPFDDVSEVIRLNLEQAEQRSERVREALLAIGEGTVYALAETLYPRALRRRFWQIIATVQGHLDVLNERGHAAFADGVWRAT